MVTINVSNNFVRNAFMYFFSLFSVFDFVHSNRSANSVHHSALATATVLRRCRQCNNQPVLTLPQMTIDSATYIWPVTSPPDLHVCPTTSTTGATATCFIGSADPCSAIPFGDLVIGAVQAGERIRSTATATEKSAAVIVTDGTDISS